MFSRDLLVLDDDVDILNAMSLIFRRAGWNIKTFSDAPSLLLEARTYSSSAVVLDVYLPATSGLDVLFELQKSGVKAPIFMMSGMAEVPLAVEAMKRGALDFIQKPFRSDEIVEFMTKAVTEWYERTSRPQPIFSEKWADKARLTRRETDILRCIAAGATSKASAQSLNISPRTVEFHRARLMQKMGAKNSADLVRIAMETSS